MQKGENFNALYYINNILEKLNNLKGGFSDSNGKKLNVYENNARFHTSKITIGFLSCFLIE